MSTFKFPPGTVEVGTPVTVPLPTPLSQFKHIQIDLPDANTMEIKTLVGGQTTPIIQKAAATAETVILDMTDVESVLLTATGGDMDFVLSAYGVQ